MDSLVIRLQQIVRLKHASHDQSSHGKRGGGGGSAAIVAKRGTPISPDQANMFDVLTPAPAPAPKPAVQQAVTPVTSAQLPTRRAPNEKVIAAHEAEIIKQMPLDRIATPEQKAAYQKLARRIAEFADENDAIREQYLYTSGPDGKLQYDESATGRRGELAKIFEERGKQIHAEIVPYAERLSRGDLSMPFDQWQKLALDDRAPMSSFGENSSAVLLRESMRVRQPNGNTPFTVVHSPQTAPADLINLTKAVADINKIVKPYVFTPSVAENKPVYMFADTEPMNGYLGYYKNSQPYVQQTVDKTGNIPIDTAAIVLMTKTFAGIPISEKQKTVSTVGIHEYGHHLEAKPGMKDYVENWYRNQVGSSVIDSTLGSEYAVIRASDGPVETKWDVPIRGLKTGTPYQQVVYAQATTPKSAPYGLRISASELTSVNLEKFHGLFIGRQDSVNGSWDRKSAFNVIKKYPDLFGAMFAVTQS
jgi:hypothetical protein